jgi:hypothetical protein
VAGVAVSSAAVAAHTDVPVSVAAHSGACSCRRARCSYLMLHITFCFDLLLHKVLLMLIWYIKSSYSPIKPSLYWHNKKMIIYCKDMFKIFLGKILYCVTHGSFIGDHH